MSPDTVTASPRAGALRELRTGLGLSREKVAARLGVSSKTIERAEQGARVKRAFLIELAELYGVRLDELEEAA
jgi:transcriptional regulator with XRE-family HTH domain